MAYTTEPVEHYKRFTCTERRIAPSTCVGDRIPMSRIPRIQSNQSIITNSPAAYEAPNEQEAPVAEVVDDSTEGDPSAAEIGSNANISTGCSEPR